MDQAMAFTIVSSIALMKIHENLLHHTGPAGELRGIAASLQEEGIFARELDTLGLAFHSPALDPLLPQLLQSRL